ncbi:MAG TPA: hypothetical protein VM536_07355, partial [Chloroflexia bacterium]|nr:hypothetical protein [Chloroflexia bacterium]
LVQDATYSALLRTDRRWLHGAVGRALEELYPGRLDLAPILASHFDEAGDDERALRYHTLGGDEAGRKHAIAEAIDHYKRALALARQAAPSASLMHLFTHCGRALELAGRYVEALATYEEMEGLAGLRGDLPLELAALLAKANVRVQPSPTYDPAVAEALCTEALALARALGDRPAEAKVLWNLLLVAKLGGAERQAGAIPYGEQSLAIARELNLREQMAQTLNDLGYSYAIVGRTADALRAGEEAAALWRELGNLPMLADSLTTNALSHLQNSRHDLVIACAYEAYAISTTVGNGWGRAYSRLVSNAVHLERAEYGLVLAHAEEAVRLGKAAGFLVGGVLGLCHMALVHALLGAYDAAERYTGEAIEAAGTQFPGWRNTALIYQARVQVLAGWLDAAGATFAEARRTIAGPQLTAQLALPQAAWHLAAGDHAAALDCVDGFLGTIDADHKVYDYLHAALFKGRALAGLAQWDAAQAVVRPACDSAARLVARRALWPLLALAAEISRALGDPAAAARAQAEARAVVTAIACAIPDAELQASFRNRPDVCALLVTGEGV